MGRNNFRVFSNLVLKDIKCSFGFFLRDFLFPPCPVGDLLENGIINLDKPFNLEVKEIEEKIKKLLGIKKAKSWSSLEKRSTGCLLFLLGSSPYLIKRPVELKEEFIGIIKVSPTSVSTSLREFKRLFENLSGFFLQSALPAFFVRRYLIFKNVNSSFLLEFNEKRGLVTFFLSCDSGLNFKTFVSGFNILVGKKSYLTELRRIRIGAFSEEDFLVSFHDLIDALWFYGSKKKDYLLRKAVLPLDMLFCKIRKVVVKDSSVNALCYGAKLAIQGILGIEKNIEKGEEILLVTSKGETIALAQSEMNTQTAFTIKTGFFAYIKIVIMPRELYPKQWGLGFLSVKKKNSFINRNFTKFQKNF